MIIYVAFVNGSPRLDITGQTADDVRQRGAKLIGGREWHYAMQNGKVQIKRLRLDVLA